MTPDTNPFQAEDVDRYALWHMLVGRDIEAFVAQDWTLIADDFLDIGFTAIDAHASNNPDDWVLSFPNLAAYRQSWLEQSADLNRRVPGHSLRQALYDASTLDKIEIEETSALVHKKFDGEIVTEAGEIIPLHWQTIYQCVSFAGRWRIAGFVGYLPFMTVRDPSATPARKQVPVGARQHRTAGPYSPVLIIPSGDLVVISGQGAIDPDGDIIGDTIEAQTQTTLHNCLQQLNVAGCDFQDVFKVNVYMTDLSQWAAFNAVYRTLLPDPKPVRTAIQAGLLPGLLVEVEMWAVKP